MGTPYDGTVPYTRTIHNRAQGYRRCQADYIPLLEAARSILVALGEEDWGGDEFRQLEAAIAAAERGTA